MPRRRFSSACMARCVAISSRRRSSSWRRRNKESDRDSKTRRRSIVGPPLGSQQESTAGPVGSQQGSCKKVFSLSRRPAVIATHQAVDHLDEGVHVICESIHLVRQLIDL